MTFDLMFVAVVALFVLGCLFHLRFNRSWSGPRHKLPAELRRAKLAYAEQLFRSVGTVSITAKVDRVYRNAAGELVLLELKTRRTPRAYPSDVIELSAQRVVVMAQTGEIVASHAYVIVESPDGRRLACNRVALMSEEEVTALALRRQSLLARGGEPRYASSPRLCKTCSFLTECNPSEGK